MAVKTERESVCVLAVFNSCRCNNWQVLQLGRSAVLSVMSSSQWRLETSLSRDVMQSSTAQTRNLTSAAVCLSVCFMVSSFLHAIQCDWVCKLCLFWTWFSFSFMFIYCTVFCRRVAREVLKSWCSHSSTFCSWCSRCDYCCFWLLFSQPIFQRLLQIGLGRHRSVTGRE